MLASIAGHVPAKYTLSTPEELVGKVRYSQAKTVAIVIHGGLVSIGDAIDTAEKVDPTFEGVCYPIYLAWESGPGFALFPPPKPDMAPRREPWEMRPEVFDAPHPLNDAERRLELNTRALVKPMWSRMNRFAAYANNARDPNAVMTRFFKALIPLWKERNLRVVLIGHSAGAIFVGRILQSFESLKPPGKVDVVFMAPACTYQFMADRLQFIKKFVSGFRLFALTDELERTDGLLNVGPAPKRVRGWYQASLLYYVSNNLEAHRDTALLGMQRFWKLANWESVETPRELTALEKSQIRSVGTAMKLNENAVWSKGATEPPLTAHPGESGWECGSARHLGFWMDSAMQRSLRVIAEAPLPALD